MRHALTLLTMTTTLLLTGCGTVLDRSVQDVTLVTPGAYEASCTLDNGTRYKMSTGETRTIMKSHHDLVIDCYADGNRRQTRTIPSGWSTGATVANTATGILPGMTYDHFSGGLYEYPSVIVVDFMGHPKTGFETPSYHNKDAPNPYDQAIEDYGPTTPRIENDSVYQKRGVEKRNAAISTNPFGEIETTAGMKTAPSPAPTTGAKKTAAGFMPMSGTPSSQPPGTTADDLNRAMNPSAFSR